MPDKSVRSGSRSYTIEDLTAQTGVTVRTVRYYISEGLLPPPHGAGPGTRYTQQHLDRLLLIGALKDAYLPLKEIRRRIAGMTDVEIHEAVAQVHVRSGEPADEDADDQQDADAVAPAMLMTRRPPDGDRSVRSSAATYIEAVLRNESESGFGTPVGSVTPRAVRKPPGSVRFPGADEPGQQADAEPATWRRVAISPEAELLIEESIYRRRSEQIEALVAWARRILTS